MKSRFLVALLGTFLLCLVATTRLTAQSELALSSDRTGRFQIFTVQLPPPSAPFEVTSGGGGNQLSREPDWSPDGTKIAYQFGAPGVRGIHTIKPDGTDDIQITPPGSGSYPCTDDSEPAWSPDGNYVAYICQNSGVFAIWEHNNNLPPDNPTSESLVFSLSNGLLFNPTWSRDGTSLAFVSAIPGSQPQIQLFSLATKVLQPLTSSSFNDFDPTFSPDGQTVAFSSTRNGVRQIFTMSVSCPETKSGCPIPAQLTMDPTGAEHCAWSSSGQWVAFVSSRVTTLNPSGKSQIYLLSPSRPEGPSNPAVPVSDGTADDDDPAWPSGVSKQPAKELGCSPWLCGDPINTATGNVFEQISDYETAGQNKLRFVRFYNSAAIATNPNTLAKSLGVNWRSMYDRYLALVSPTSISAERADGQVLTFNLFGSDWISDTDVDVTVTESGSTWSLRDRDDTVETFTMAGTKGTLSSIEFRGGYTLNLQYNASGQLTSVTDSYHRSLQLTYSNGLLSTVNTPDGLVLTYGYTLSGTSQRLATLTYSTSPTSMQTYLYENSAFPFSLTGIVDENGKRFATWTYDSMGRGLTSQHGSGADLTTISYDDKTGNRTVKNGLGERETYKFGLLQGVHKASEIDRLATSTTAAAKRIFTYDDNGYTASATDWNGNLTTYENDVHGDPTTINEAVGTPQARTTTLIYDSTFVHLPSTVTTQGVTTSYTYDVNGNLLTKTFADTTTQTVPYSTNGQKRTWTFTWQNFLMASSKTPNGKLTNYGYDSTGALTSTKNALSQITKITQHTGGGYPLVTLDPNGVTTTMTYDARLRLLTTTVSALGQPSFTTTNTYGPAGNLTGVQLPDQSKLTYAYDPAHRLIGMTDLFGNSTSYTLDAFGDVTLTKVTGPTGTVTRQHSGVFDALGRVLQDIGGLGQTTKYTYDNNGNALTITDPNKNLTKQTFDPLNRLSTVTDPAPGGVTNATYDQHDRILTVTDANKNVTSYVYDGFGDKIQTVSPDTQSTVYHYDADGNLTQSTNAAGAIANYTYDALDRVLTTNYPSDVAENVVYTYDQPGHGFGIGHLTSLQDAAGTLSRAYDERGNVLSEKRANGATLLQMAYSYDGASRLASITYPSTAVASYTRDAMGRITTVSAKLPSATSFATVASGIAYEPFGPAETLTYGNNVNETSVFDLDYRLMSLTDKGTAVVQELVYGYDGANNVLSIADKVTASSSQTFAYDPLNRLKNASGSYGSQSWTYDPVGNRLTQLAGGVSTTYNYATGTNRISSITSGNTKQTVGTTAAGNINSFSSAFSNVTSLTYNQANRLATTNSGTTQLTQYTYNGFGQRIVKVGSATAKTLFQYDQSGHLLEQTDGTGKAQVDYIYLGDRPIATLQPSNGKVYFLHNERLGTPQRATDSTQAVVWSADYQPFGYTNTGAGTIVQNLRLPGQEFEVETWWNHNGFRDYAPTLGRYVEPDPLGLFQVPRMVGDRFYNRQTGRFLSEDPIGFSGGSNLYAYVRNNPTGLVDPTGRQWEFALLEAMIVGAYFWQNSQLYAPYINAAVEGALGFFGPAAPAETLAGNIGSDLSQAIQGFPYAPPFTLPPPNYFNSGPPILTTPRAASQANQTYSCPYISGGNNPVRGRP